MKKRSAIIAATIFIVTLCLYLRSAFFPFSIIDDKDYVTANPKVLAGLTADSIRWAFTAFHASNWHPLTWLSLMLDSQLFGSNPAGYHVVNALLHAANSVLFFALFRFMTGAVWRSAFVAACFALHPLHVESVAWVAERKDVLSTLFWALTLLFYCAYVKERKRNWYLLSLAVFALGLMAKPMLVTIPVILIVMDYWPLRRRGSPLAASGGAARGSWVLDKLPFLALSVLSSLLTVGAQGKGGSVSTLAMWPLSARLSNIFWSLTAYLQKMLYPAKLAVYYPFVILPYWKAVCAAFIVVGITIVVLVKRRKYPYLIFGWFWYLITLLPVIGIVQVGSQAMADRYTYIPLIGIFTIVAWGAVDLKAAVPRLKAAINLVAGLSLIACAVTTYHQLGFWETNNTLVTHGLEVTDNNEFLHAKMALLYEDEGRPDLALAHWAEAVRICPGYVNGHLGYALLLTKQWRIDEAIIQYREALQYKPGDERILYQLNILQH